MKPWRSLLQYLPALILLTTGALALGYGIGANFLGPNSYTTITTTTTATTATTETSFSTVSTTLTTVRTQTYTTTVRATANTSVAHPNSHSTSVTIEKSVGRNNNSSSAVLFALSIDRPSYRLGETMHIKGSVTNLSPTTNVTLILGEYQIYVFNSTGGEVWTSPIGFYDGLDNLRPMYTREYTLTPEETLELDYATADWNFTGLEVTPKVTASYTGTLVPEGTYIIEWSPLFGADLGQLAQITREPIKINFTITPATISITTNTITATTPQTKTYSTTITETVNRTTTVTVTTTTTKTVKITAFPSLCWSTYQHDYQRTGYSAGKAPQNNFILWVNHNVTAEFASPIVADGKFFIYSGGYTYAIDALTGSTIWKVATSIGVQPQLTYYNGSIIQGTRSSGLAIIDAETGSISSLSASNVLSMGGGAPIVDDRGVVYFGENHLQKPSPNSPYSTFFAYYLKNRTKLWEFSLPTDEQITSSPAITVDWRIVIFSAQHGLHALNASNGQQLWMFNNTSSGIQLSGASISGGRVFTVGTDGFIYALNQQNGSIVWRTQIASSISDVDSPAVGGGKVFASDGYKLYALDSEKGAVVWSFNLGKMESSPTVSGGLVFAVSTDGVLYALKESDGSVAWNLQLPVKYNTNMISAAVCDGVVFAGSDQGIWAIGARP